MPLQPDSLPNHLGCFHENLYQPDLSGEPPSVIAQAEACFKHCSIGAWSFAAIRNRTVCTCGDTFNKYGSAPETECSTACPEESSVFDHCGGPEANSVYSIGAVVPNVPWPVPSVGPPTVGNPVPPNPDDSAVDHSKHDHNTNKAAIIASSVVVTAIILGMMLMFVRRRRQIETQPREKGPAHGPFPTTTTRGGRRTLLRDDSSKGGGATWSAPQKTQPEKMDRDIEAQLFAGFESCAVLEEEEEDPQHEHQPVVVHPLAAHQRPSQDRNHFNKDQNSPPSSLYPVDNDSTHQTRVPSFVSKIGEKLSYLRVKTQYLQPTHCPSISLSPSPSTLSGIYPPISPISPMSPASLFSSEDAQQQQQHPHHCPPLSIKATEEEGWEQCDADNKTPSFSTDSAPIPGPVSNNTNHSRKLKRLSSHSHHHQHWSPISENSGGGNTGVLSISGPPQAHQTKAQADKQRRSKLIQDLILHGD